MKRFNDDADKNSLPLTNNNNNNNNNNNKKIKVNEGYSSIQNINQYTLQNRSLLSVSASTSTFLNNSMMNSTATSNISSISNISLTTQTKPGISKEFYLEEIRRFLICHQQGLFDNINNSLISVKTDQSTIAPNDKFQNISPILEPDVLNLTTPITPIHPINKSHGTPKKSKSKTKSHSPSKNKSNISTTSTTFKENSTLETFPFSAGAKIWLLHISNSMYLALESIVPKKDIHRIIYNLLGFVLDNNLFLNNNNNNNNNNNRNRNNNSNNIKERLPISSRLLTISDILNRNRNLSSKSSVSENQILRILVGKVSSIQSNQVSDRHILTLQDSTGEIVVEITQTQFYLLDSIAFIPFFNLICISPSSKKETPSLLSMSMSRQSRLSLLDINNVGNNTVRIDISKSNYIEVDNIYIIYRNFDHYYEEMIRKFKVSLLQQSQFISPAELSSTRNQKLEMYIIDQNQPYQSIRSLNQLQDQVLQSINVYGTVLSKSAIPHTQATTNKENEVHTLFFIQIIDIASTNEQEKRKSKIFLLFSGDSLKYFNLFHIGNSYLFCNVGFQSSLENTETKQNVIIINNSTKIYQILEQSFFYLESIVNNNKLIESNNNNSNNSNSNNNINNNNINSQYKKQLQFSQPNNKPILEYLNYNLNYLNEKLPSFINCLVEITQELNSHFGTIGIDRDGILFLSHYRSHLFHARGFRIGTKIALFNVHPIYHGSRLLGVAMCQSSSFKFTKFDNTRLFNHIPFSKSTLLGENQSFSDLWKKYSIVNCFALSKLLLKLQNNFPDVFGSLEQFKTMFLNKPIYENIANLFGIPKLNNEGSLKKYDHILSHSDGKCDSYVEDTVQNFKLLNLSKLSTLKSNKSPIVFNNSKDYHLVGLLEVSPRGFEWGKVSLKIDSNTSVDCFVQDINEYHLNKIWKINKFLIKFEDYQENKQIKSINYIQFSMDDCDLLSPMLNKTLFYNNLPFQLLFDQFQVNISKVLDIQDQTITNHQLSEQQQKEQKQLLNQTLNLFILLLEKTVEAGLITLTAVLLIPSLPKVLIYTASSLKINFPILQKGSCYYLSGVLFKPITNNNKASPSPSAIPNNSLQSDIYSFSLSASSILKSVALIYYIDKSGFVVLPSTLKSRKFSQYTIPQILIRDKSFFRKTAKYISNINSNSFVKFKSIEEIYNGDNVTQNDFVSFKGLIVSKRIEETITTTQKGGQDKTIVTHLVCTDPNYPGKHFLPISIENYYYGMTIGSIIEFYFLQTKSTFSLIQENLQFGNKNNNISDKLKSNNGKSNYLCHSNRFFYYQILEEEKDFSLFDFIPPTKLSDINKKSLDQHYRVVADILQIEKLELSFKCINCSRDCIGCVCIPKVYEQFLFNGILECEINDGTIPKKLIIKKDSTILSIFNLSKEILKKIKEFSINNKIIFSYEKPSMEKKREFEEILIAKNNPEINSKKRDRNGADQKDLDSDGEIDLNLSAPIVPESTSQFISNFPILKDIFSKNIPTTLEFILMKSDIEGLVLKCNEINFINTSARAWALLKQVKQIN
ncbi:hypothetical protein DICPUDRAFT_74620 [Dictyostelium purpureum]|uniref:CST complex subunit CTC1 n=1 Tax=Dictyostelium purpureum TaxID=5786 RepID=F0Z8A0_DICPU|nr:uncharacterized protein DICPUDRAFT_74620 [Dictyostelium purpureum]EGC39858.1 hypothetical protein DICPUDRAFT_74620 [Dictyostelium purpureum]|eukprot:XP_003283609.1 hypothetical protein DICPUDRAFT_74620 [Dictyostelium purpureum]